MRGSLGGCWVSALPLRGVLASLDRGEDFGDLREPPPRLGKLPFGDLPAELAFEGLFERAFGWFCTIRVHTPNMGG